MKLLKLIFVCLGVLLPIGTPFVAQAQNGRAQEIEDREHRKPLIGIARIFLSDVEVEKNIADDGVDAAAIKTSVENKLRLAGLKIEPVSSMVFTPFTTRPQMISITIESLKVEGMPSYCYTVRFEVTNYVIMIQNKKVSHAVVVWEQHILGYAGVSRLSVVKDFCDKFADEFINDWLKAKDETTDSSNQVQNKHVEDYLIN